MNKIKILLLIIICSTFNNLYSQEHKERFHLVLNDDNRSGGANEDGVYIPANYEVFLPIYPLESEGTYDELWLKYDSNQYILIYYNDSDFLDTIGQKDSIYIPSQDELSEILDHHHPDNFFDDFKPTELGYKNTKQNPESLLIVKNYINILLYSIKKENIDFFAECAKTLKITKHRDFLKWKVIENVSEEISKAEDFNDFRKRFYSDSIFQMSRIVFPLEGACNAFYDEIEELINLADTNADCFYVKDHIFYWNKEAWTFIGEFKDKEFQMEEYKFKTTISGDDKSKEERITNKDIYISNGFILEYKLIDGKWYLTYFDSYSY